MMSDKDKSRRARILDGRTTEQASMLALRGSGSQGAVGGGSAWWSGGSPSPSRYSSSLAAVVTRLAFWLLLMRSAIVLSRRGLPVSCGLVGRMRKQFAMRKQGVPHHSAPGL
jgi:hypothetical protein